MITNLIKGLVTLAVFLYLFVRALEAAQSRDWAEGSFFILSMILVSILDHNDRS